MNTLSTPPPTGAVLLLNGKELSNWTTREGKPAGWKDETLRLQPSLQLTP